MEITSVNRYLLFRVDKIITYQDSAPQRKTVTSFVIYTSY